MGLGNLNPGCECCEPPCDWVCLPCIDDCAPFAFRVVFDDLNGGCEIYNGTYDVEHLIGFTCVFDQTPAGFLAHLQVTVSPNKITVDIDIAEGFSPTVHTFIVWEKDYSPGEVPCLTMVNEEIPFKSKLGTACDDPPSVRVLLTSLSGP